MRSGTSCAILLLPLLALAGESEGDSLRPGGRSRERSRVDDPPVLLTIETKWKIRYVETVDRVDGGRPVAVTRRYARSRREERRKLGDGPTRRERHTADIEGGALSLRADAEWRVIAPMGEVDEGFLHGLDWSWVLPAARTRAFLEGRGYVTPHDVKAVAMDVLRHRVITTCEAEAEGLTSENVIRRVLDTVPVP